MFAVDSGEELLAFCSFFCLIKIMCIYKYVWLYQSSQIDQANQEKTKQESI